MKLAGTGWVNTLGSALALLGALLLLAFGIGLALYVDQTYERQHLDQIAAQARILAATATAALAFGDKQAADEYVGALRANPDILAAALYTESGALFATYPKVAAGVPRSAAEATASRPASSLHYVTAPVRQGDAVLGLALVETQTEPLARRVQRQGAIALLVAMAVLLVVVLAVSQGALRRANAALATRANDLATAYNLLQEQIAERERVEAALRQSQKMEAIGQLTGGVAHDFNNLLQIVLGSLERLRARAARGDRPLDPDLARMADAATMGASRAATLTQRLLAFSRRQPLAPRELDLNRLVSGMSDLLVRTLGESIQIETVLAAGLWRTLADENQLENALLNLAVNARDAMGGRGKLTIETGNALLDEAYARIEDDVRPGQYIMLAVTDTGTGMPPEIAAKVFEPFFTTKRLGEGTGLGLSTVYGFVKQSGGHVKIYTEVGQGTTVKLYLPRLSGVGRPGDARAEPPAVMRGTERELILVVEDEAGVRALTTEMLRDLGYRVLDAADGASALAALARTPEVDLLFTDVGLPGDMNGRELADAAVRLLPELKVLFTTGYARNAIVHHGRLDPGVELISKPFSSVDLAHRVRAVLDASTPPVAS